MKAVQAQNVYGGTIGIYWPDGGGKRSFFISPEINSSQILEQAIVEEVRSALMNRRPQPRITWSAIQESISRQAFNALKAKGSTEVEAYIAEFDKEMAAKNERSSDAEREISRLKAEVARYEKQIPTGPSIVLRTGKEQDFYPGELVEVVRSTIENAISGTTQDSRRSHILQAILSENVANDTAEQKKTEIKNLLRGYQRMDAKIRRGLVEMGFKVEEDGKHYKLTYQDDDRYTFTLPKSGSDHRGGLNAANDISRLFF
jgi:hypothetical protein